MHSWLFFLTLIADTSCIILFLDFAFDLPFELAPKLTSLLVQLCSRYHTWTPDSLFEAGKPISAKHPYPIKRLGRNYDLRKVMIDESPKDADAEQTLSTASQVKGPRSVSGSRRPFGAPIAKGSGGCPTHNGCLAGCATFFTHRGYDYKLLEDGQLFIRRSGSDAYRFAKWAILQPGQPLHVSPDDSGSEAVIFCFGTSHRVLGEIGPDWVFSPIQTCYLTDNESSEVSYTLGQGCAFNKVYTGSSVDVPSGPHYGARYDIGWTCYDEHRLEDLSSVAEGCFPDDCPPLPGHRTPLEGSMHGIDLVGNSFPSDNYTGAGSSVTQVYHVEVELDNPLPAQALQQYPSITSSSAPSTLPASFVPSPTADTIPAGSASTSRSVMRRTCQICHRVMRRPSALTIHMNAHRGIRPFKCDYCSYSSTNVTNLQRHQRTAGHGGGSSAGEI